MLLPTCHPCFPCRTGITQGVDPKPIPAVQNFWSSLQVPEGADHLAVLWAWAVPWAGCLAWPCPASWCAAPAALSHGRKLLGKLMIYLPKQILCLTLALSQMKSPMFSKCSKPFLLPFFLPLKMCCSQSLSPRHGVLLLRVWLVWYKTDTQAVPCFSRVQLLS